MITESLAAYSVRSLRDHGSAAWPSSLAASCPVCNLHLRSFASRHDEIMAAGVREVVVFHSRRETMLEFQGQLPFAAIADPERKLYSEFGVGNMSPLVALDPRS